MGLLKHNSPTIVARSVAKVTPNNNCITLLGANSTTLNVKGGATVNATHCGVYLNSSDSSAGVVVGSSVLNTQYVRGVGQVKQSGGGTINATDGIQSDMPALSDPYANVAIPSYSGCSSNNYSLNSGNVTINPGTYCGGISVKSKAKLNLNPGVYIMDRGDFSATAQTTVTGSGVTIILTSSTGSNFGKVSFAGGATVTLSAPTTGSLANMLFYGDRRAPSNLSNKMTGGSTQSLTGILYFPSTELDFAGKSSGATSCIGIVANNVTFTGGASFGTNCPNTWSTAGGITALSE